MSPGILTPSILFGEYIVKWVAKTYKSSPKIFSRILRKRYRRSGQSVAQISGKKVCVGKLACGRCRRTRAGSVAGTVVLSGPVGILIGAIIVLLLQLWEAEGSY